MKKQIERFKVRIDQNLNRSEKSVALTPELLKIEETIAVYKQVCTTLQKKFSEGLQAFGKGTDGPAIDRRLKKTSDFVLGQSISELGRTLSKQNSSSCLAQALVEMGGVCSSLAHNQVQYEISIENIVIARLQEVLVTDLPNILAGRKQLDRLILELDTIKSRLDKSREEEASGAPGAAARTERNIEDLDDTARKVEQARDNLASEMLMFLAKDDELAGLIQQYLDFRHKLNVDNTVQMQSVKPRMAAIRAARRGFPIFGSDLREHISSFGIESGVAFPIQLCVSKLMQLGLEEEGLFRLAAGTSKVKRLRAEIEAGQASLASLEGCDHHVLTATIKTYLRELPSPLMGDELYDDWLEAASLQGEDRFDAIWNLLQSEHLPRENYRNIHYLFKFLNEVCSKSDVNKMNASNLAIVITPNVIWSTEAVHDVMDVGLGGQLAQVIELIIEEQSWFFQNDPPIVWDEKLTPLGTCLPANAVEEPTSSFLGQSLASAINLPVNIASSPLPASRDKNKKNKKAPAPPPSPLNNGHQVQSPESPVSLRRDSRKEQSRESYSRSKSVETGNQLQGRGHQLQHPSQPPPKPPVDHPAQPPPKPPTNRSSLENELTKSSTSPHVFAAISSPNSPAVQSPAKQRHSNDGTPLSPAAKSAATTSRPRAATTGNASPPKSRSNKADISKEDERAQPRGGGAGGVPGAGGQPAGHVEPDSISQIGSVYTVHTSLYPDLSSQEVDDILDAEDPATMDARPGYPVPAPRTIKPALPSKPQGLARNVSVRAATGSRSGSTGSGGCGGGGGGGDEQYGDSTRM